MRVSSIARSARIFADRRNVHRRCGRSRNDEQAGPREPARLMLNVPETRRRFRSPQIPVRSFSRVTTNHPRARPCTPPARQHTVLPLCPTPESVSPMSPSAPEIWLCHLPKTKQSKPLIGFVRPKMGIGRVRPRRTKPHNSAQRIRISPQPAKRPVGQASTPAAGLQTRYPILRGPRNEVRASATI
jgi:hypothetical protein